MEQPVRTDDRLQIEEALTFYTRGLDARDADVLLKAFHHDAQLTVDEVLYQGHGQLLEAAAAMWAELSSTTHVTSGYRVVFAGRDDAEGTGCGTAHSVSPDGSVEFAAGWYEDKWQRRDGRWRLTNRVVVLTQRVTFGGVAVQGVGATAPRIGRD